MNRKQRINIIGFILLLTMGGLLNTIVIIIPMIVNLWVDLVAEWDGATKWRVLLAYIIFGVVPYTILEIIKNNISIKLYKEDIQNETLSNADSLRNEDLQRYVELVRQLTPNPDLFRVGLFIKKRKKKLSLRYYAGNYSQVEKNMVFDPNEGLVGYVLANYHSYEDGSWFYADLQEITKEQLEQTWHMKEEQIKATKDLTLILAVPVVGSNNKLLGVLAIDTADRSGKYTGEWLLNIDETDKEYGDFSEVLTYAAQVCAELLQE